MAKQIKKTPLVSGRGENFQDEIKATQTISAAAETSLQVATAEGSSKAREIMLDNDEALKAIVKFL
jgi:hypothetical protein